MLIVLGYVVAVLGTLTALSVRASLKHARRERQLLLLGLESADAAVHAEAQALGLSRPESAGGLVDYRGTTRGGLKLRVHTDEFAQGGYEYDEPLSRHLLAVDVTERREGEVPPYAGSSAVVERIPLHIAGLEDCALAGPLDQMIARLDAPTVTALAAASGALGARFEEDIPAQRTTSARLSPRTLSLQTSAVARFPPLGPVVEAARLLGRKMTHEQILERLEEAREDDHPVTPLLATAALCSHRPLRSDEVDRLERFLLVHELGIPFSPKKEEAGGVVLEAVASSGSDALLPVALKLADAGRFRPSVVGYLADFPSEQTNGGLIACLAASSFDVVDRAARALVDRQVLAAVGPIRQAAARFGDAEEAPQNDDPLNPQGWLARERALRALADVLAGNSPDAHAGALALTQDEEGGALALAPDSGGLSEPEDDAG